jgi:hypothetical protein
MKRELMSLALLVVSGVFIGTASAQRPIRIQFSKGASSTALKGSTGTAGTTYVIRARSGQKIVIDLAPTSRLGIKVEHDGRFGHEVMLREEKGGHYEVGLEESGDYTIFIGSTSGKPVNFNMTVRVTKMTDI